MTELYEIRIGKAGLTDNIANEIKARLEKLGTVKIKVTAKQFDINESGSSKQKRKEYFKEIAQKCEANIADFKGFTLTLKKQ